MPTINTKALVIFLSIFSVVLVALLALKFSTAEPSSIPSGESSLTSSTLPQPTPHRKEISREELLSLNLVETSSDLKIVESPREFNKENSQLISSLITICDQSGKKVAQVNAAKAVAFAHSLKEIPLGREGFQQFYLQEGFRILAVNSLLREVYIDVSLVESTRQIFVEHFIISLGFDGGIKKLASATEDNYSNYRLSGDNTSLSYVSLVPAPDNKANTTLEAGRKGSLKETKVFTIIDLIGGDIIRFPLPGDAMTFALSKKSTFKYPAAVGNYLVAYRFADSNTIEFTRFFRDYSPKTPDGPQASDKELWIYNIKTGKLTLLQTIPFKPTTSTSTEQVH